jgi:hypothetical protein
VISAMVRDWFKPGSGQPNWAAVPSHLQRTCWTVGVLLVGSLRELTLELRVSTSNALDLSYRWCHIYRCRGAWTTLPLQGAREWCERSVPNAERSSLSVAVSAS